MIFLDRIPGTVDLEKTTGADIRKIAGWIRKKYGKQVLLEIAREQAVKEAKHAINKMAFDFEKLKTDFLKSRRCAGTRRTYDFALRLFCAYLNRNGIHALDVKAHEVDGFIAELRESNYGPATQRLQISAISAFYTKLERWEYISHSFWRGAVLPEITRVRELRVPNGRDIERIRRTIRGYNRPGGPKGSNMKETHHKALMIFDLLVETGIRVGAISTLKIGQGGILSGFSKGKPFEREIDRGLAQRLKGVDFPAVTKRAVQRMIALACKRSGTAVYNCHSFRHYFAIRHFEKNRDIYALSRLLNHAGIAVTESYLKSLNVK